MNWLDIVGMACAVVFVIIAAVATFAPLAGFTKEEER